MVTALMNPASTEQPLQQEQQQSGRNAAAVQRPQNVGILAVDIYFPSVYVDQTELEQFDGVSAGKYTIGLGQEKMAFCEDNEDICSISLTVVKNLMTKYNISYKDIGRLEVGTETIIDKSKSVKSVLMSLFQEHDNADVEGVDTTNACYGGTNALFNSINWIESSAWDGRYALVVAGDIAVYASGSARPTGGAGVVALLIGPNAPLVFDNVRASHMEHVYDFYKPDLSSEFPTVDGPLTIECYYRALDNCYLKYVQKSGAKFDLCETFDYLCFHSPYTKLVQKSFARLAFIDLLNNEEYQLRKDSEYEKFSSLQLEQTYFNKEVEKAFVTCTKKSFNDRVLPSLLAAKNIGNMYCGSLYGGLVSLLCNIAPQDLLGKKIGLFSYGSGLASSMFSIRVRDDLPEQVAAQLAILSETVDLKNRLNSRLKKEPSDFVQSMKLREDVHNLKDYTPKSDPRQLFDGTFYLSAVDAKYRRSYALYSANAVGEL
ncbi:hypothetical protein MP228_002009 [Amoeboaphelidium protococcarum]|nr:hypothetical protein MP228_002009 [Amoeboaphelidium protococcarum]